MAQLTWRVPDTPQSLQKQPPKIQGTLELRNVTFAYPTRPDAVILDDFSLEVRPGEVVAIVGPSGGGKSSIMSLLLSFYSPDQGSVLLDGVPIHEYDAAFVRNRVGWVGQEPVLHGRSIRKNIVFGVENEKLVSRSSSIKGVAEPTLEEVIEAAKLANAHDFITSLPDGYDTDVGEKGTQVCTVCPQLFALN